MASQALARHFLTMLAVTEATMCSTPLLCCTHRPTLQCSPRSVVENKHECLSFTCVA